MSSKPNRAPLQSEIFRIRMLEILKYKPPFDRTLMRSLGVRGLNCGSGPRLFPQWLNTDLFRPTDSHGNQSLRNRITLINGEFLYLEHDVAERFPFRRGSFDWVYSEHFIEHLAPDVAVTWLKDVYRLLRPSGLFRLTTPDLARYVRGYLNRKDGFFAKHRRRISHLVPGGVPKRRAWMLNQIFYFWEHRWLYDFEEIVHTARLAGFPTRSVRRCGFQQGQVPEVSRLDWDYRSDETLYVEMLKQSS